MIEYIADEVCLLSACASNSTQKHNMKLHLPKMLLAALIAALGSMSAWAADTAWTFSTGTDGAGNAGGIKGIIFELSGNARMAAQGDGAMPATLTLDSITLWSRTSGTTIAQGCVYLTDSSNTIIAISELADAAANGASVTYTFAQTASLAHAGSENQNRLDLTTGSSYKLFYLSGDAATISAYDKAYIGNTLTGLFENDIAFSTFQSAGGTSTNTALCGTLTDLNSTSSYAWGPQMQIVTHGEYVAATDFVWVGAVDGMWDTSTRNWTYADTPDSQYVSANTSRVVFGADASTKDIKVQSAIIAGATSVSAAYSYALSDSGSLSLSSLSVAGGASATFTGANAATNTVALSELGGAGDVTVGAGATVNLTTTQGYTGLLKVAGGVLNLGANNHAISLLEVASGVATTTRHANAGCISGDIQVRGGGSFQVNGQHDAFGWGNIATKNIILTGASESELAKLELNQTSPNSVTMATHLKLEGYASVLSKEGTKGFNTYGGTITAANTKNHIDLVDLRSHVDITVEEGGELDISSTSLNSENAAKTMAKKGAGSLTISTSAVAKGLTVEAGEMTLAGSADIQGATTVSGGELVLTGGNVALQAVAVSDGAKLVSSAGNGNLTGALTGAGTLEKSGTGVLKLSAGGNTIASSLVSGGTLQVAADTSLASVALSDGEIKVSSAVDMSAGILNQTGGTVTVDASSSLSLGTATLSSAVANSGIVTFGGITTLTMEETKITAGYINESDMEDANNGFVKPGSSYVQVVDVQNGSSSSASASASFIVDGKTYASTAYEASTGRVITQAVAEIDWTLFEINTGSHDLSAIQAESAKHSNAIKTVKLIAGTLNVNSSDLTSGVVNATGGSISMGGAVGTVNVGGGTVEFSGSSIAATVNVTETSTIGGAMKTGSFNVASDKVATLTGASSLGNVNVEGTLTLQVATTAEGGSIASLATTAPASLKTTGDLSLDTSTGTGSLDIGGSLTLGGAVSLADVKAGSVALETGSSLTLTGALDTNTVDLSGVSLDLVMLKATSLAAETGTDFLVNLQTVVDMNLQEGQTVTLATLDNVYGKGLKVNGRDYIYRDGDQLSYSISQNEDKDIILTAQTMKGDYVWGDGAGDEKWSNPANWAGGKVPTAEDNAWVQIDKPGSLIDMDEPGTADRVTVYKDADGTIMGKNPLDITNLLEVNEGAELTIGSDGSNVAVTVPDVELNGTVNVLAGASLEADSIDMTASAMNAEVGSTVATGVLTGDADSTLEGFGTVTITGKGTRYQGKYAGATVAVAKGGDAVLYAGEGLNLAGAGSAQLVYTKDTAISGIHAEGLALTLNHAEADNSGVTLVLEEGSSLKNGKILTGLSAVGTAASIDSADAPHLVSTAGASLKRSMAAPGLDLTGSTVVLTQSEGADVTQMEVNNGGKTKGLVLAHLGAANTESAVQLNGNLFAKYYKNARLVGGEILVDMNDTYYQGLVRPTTANGRAGAAMLDDAFVLVNPQQTAPDSDLAKLMDALESGAVPASAADSVAAAVSGASAAAMGAAFGADVERQLRAIRNRTTSMGCAECVVNEEMPYVNAWVNAEGDYRKLDADSTLAGYKMSSWGATLGVDLDFTNRFTAGLAVTAMQGDFTADSAETATGDLDRLYLSAFARYSRRAWTHTAVATFGKADANLKRTVDYGAGSYSTKGDMSGTAFGLMYEVGYTKALTEDASVCLQPVFNISYRHSALGSYTETGSDAALRMGDMEMDTVTFGLGARMQGTIGTSVYNRTSVVELRALAKLDAGDRDCAAKAGIAGLPAASREVQSAEYGAFGVEVGAGLLVPLGEYGGTLFCDAAAELRSGYTNVNGTVGYRFNF